MTCGFKESTHINKYIKILIQ
uniref:Uncharacterized protein n=1 Tax=Anguilla anguilla TaxID=7936 RepID=A0A0E9QZ55_ANGAN